MAKVQEYLGVIRSGQTVKGASYVLSKIIADGKEAQTFDSHVVVGDEGELTYNDKYKTWEFTKKKRATTAPATKYQADPKKLKQELTLEVAKNLSIQRQVALKGVVDLIVAGKRTYKDLVVTFDDLMFLLNRRELQTRDVDEIAEEPPLEAYDEEPFE